jgi:hypothetical protein
VIAALALLAQVPAAQPPAPALETWPALPTLLYERDPDDLGEVSRFVQDEVEAGRCGTPLKAGENRVLRVRVVVLVGPDGRARALVPEAIGCPTVEQYTAGVIGRLVAGNVRQPWPTQAQWLRTGLVYSWSKGGPD